VLDGQIEKAHQAMYVLLFSCLTCDMTAFVNDITELNCEGCLFGEPWLTVKTVPVCEFTRGC